MPPAFPCAWTIAITVAGLQALRKAWMPMHNRLQVAARERPGAAAKDGCSVLAIARTHV